ncbi:MAG: glycerophosphodiester phosphodiesterase [Sporichthyaceae bacterium]
MRRALRAAALFATASSLTLSGFFGAPAGAQTDAPAAQLQVVGHRGGTDYGAENTLSTLRHAWEVGADAVEVDVRFTSEGVPMLMHDETLDRTTDCSGKIAERTYAEVRRCDAGIGDQVPNLYELIEFLETHPMHLYLDVKYTQFDAQYRTVIDVLTSLGYNDGAKATMIGGAGVAPRLKALGAKRVGLVFATAGGWNEDYPVLVPFFTEVTAALVRSAQERGAKVVAVESYPVTMAQAVLGRLGLDGFMADQLDKTLQQLNRYRVPPNTRSSSVQKRIPFVPSYSPTPDGT